MLTGVAEYHAMAVCLRGHIETQFLEEWDGSPPGYRLRQPPSAALYCVICGQKVISACPSCGERIRGPARGEFYGEPLDAPFDFCDFCGIPFPWASRQARIYQLRDLLDAENIDDATKLKVREDLDAILKQDLSEDEELRRWERVKKLAPGVLKAGGPIVRTLATDYLRQKLGLP
jgi:hypothetical protein